MSIGQDFRALMMQASSALKSGTINEQMVDRVAQQLDQFNGVQALARYIDPVSGHISNLHAGTIKMSPDGLRIDGGATFGIFTGDQYYNQEAIEDGDIIIGDNATGQPNILWDKSLGKLYARSGQTVAAEISGATFQSYGASVLGEGPATTNDIVTSTATTITFDNAIDQERYDDADFFSTATPDRITIPSDLGGVYLIGAGGEWETTWNGVGEFWISINGVEPYSPLSVHDASFRGSSVGISYRDTHERQLDGGDVVRLRAKQDSGSNKEFRYGFIWLRKMR